MAVTTRVLALSLFLSALLRLTFAASMLQEIITRKLVAIPDEDPFYTPPAGFEKLAPGALIKSRPIPGNLSLDNKNAIAPQGAWQLMYRSINSVGDPEATVVTVIKPYNANPKKLFVYGFFSEAAYNACNPSVALQAGARQDAAFTQQQNYIVVTALHRGWYVSVADDSGPVSAFGTGIHSAYSTLDSIRAIKQSKNITGIDPNMKVGMYGYSASASAIGLATEVQPSYAPELKLDGAAIGGLPPNTTLLLENFNKNDRASFIPPVILGLSYDYKNMSDWLKANLVPEHAQEFRKAEKQCFDSNWAWAGHDMTKFFKNGYDSLFKDPVPLSVMHWSGAMGIRDTPTVPWYLFATSHDDATPIAVTDALVDKYCKNGASIVYERNPLNLDHRMESVWGTPGAFEYLEDRLNGVPPKPGCKTFELSAESMRALGKGSMFLGLWQLLMTAAGFAISGPGGSTPST